MCFPSMAFFMVLDLFPDTLLACMRCVNFNFVYFWSYPDLFPHTEKGHLSYFSNILQKEKSAEKSALFHLLSLLPWHQYHALNVERYVWFDVRFIFASKFKFAVIRKPFFRFVVIYFKITQSIQLEFHRFYYTIIPFVIQHNPPQLLKYHSDTFLKCVITILSNNPNKVSKSMLLFLFLVQTYHL